MTSSETSSGLEESKFPPTYSQSQSNSSEGRVPAPQSPNAPPPSQEAPATIHYSENDLIKIFKKCGKFVHPLEQPDHFSIKEEDSEVVRIIEDMTHSRPNVLLQAMRSDPSKIGVRTQHVSAVGQVERELDRIKRWKGVSSY